MWRRPTRDYTFRYLVISILFCVVCVFYLGRLFYIQISGRQNSYSDDTTTQRVTVQAVRGEIYDRNGKKLVANEYTYALVVSHATFSRQSVQKSNESCLKLMEALVTCDEVVAYKNEYFPFVGTYPNYTETEEFANRDSIPYYRMKRIVSDLKLDENITPTKLVEYYLNKYQLLATDQGGARLYSDAEVDKILRVRYDMDALRFNSSNDYKFVTGISAASRLIRYVSELGIAGVDFVADVTRVYEYPGYASHILGQIGPIYAEEWERYNALGYQMNATVGKSGCELAFEQYLRGSDGVKEIELDSSGQIIKETVITPPKSGKDVYLTLDIDLQIAAEDGLAENVKYVVDNSAEYTIYGYGCNAGAAVAMDPETFEVLAIASYPTFNLETFNKDYDSIAANEAKPQINRALNGQYAPGSTYKLGVAAAALMEKAITPSEIISCTGVYGREWTHPVECTHYGNANLATAIGQSCNSYFCDVGIELGISKIEEYMGKFGFGKSTGLELGGTSGQQAGPTWRQDHNSILGPWNHSGDTGRAAIGQAETLSSPLQIACYMATLANGGTRYTAHLLHSVYEYGNDEQPIYTFEQNESTVLDRVEIPKSTWSAIADGMEQVIGDHDRVERWMRTIPVAVGGKTGTAETSADCDNALFVAAAPSETPDIVISVILEQGHMGEKAALTAARILEAFYGVSNKG